MIKKLAIFLILSAVFLISQEEAKIDVWKPLQFLEGSWFGRGAGSKVTQEYQFVLNRKFLQMKTRAVFEPTEKKPEGEVHEDMGIFSYDQFRKKFVLRSFYVEGFVNQYILDNTSEYRKTLTFVTEQIENAPIGTKAKLIYKIINNDEMEQSFHVAWPGKEYSCYSVNNLKKK